jgi:hypothetical protein
MRVVWHNYKARFAMLLRRKCCFVPRHETTELTSGWGQTATGQQVRASATITQAARLFSSHLLTWQDPRHGEAAFAP